MVAQRDLKARAAFTLAELLAVAAIIGILFAISLPKFGKITGQTRLRAAAGAVHSAARMARQYAIANNQPTYLVFSEGQNDPADAYRAYAVFSINIHTNVSPIPQQAGFFVTGWDRLPAGVVFDPRTGGSTNLFQPTADQWNGALSKKNELLIGEDVFVVQGFSPDGASGSASHFIHLAEGAVVNGEPLIRRPGPGIQIRFSTTGKSRAIDYSYETDGGIRLMGADR